MLHELPANLPPPPGLGKRMGMVRRRNGLFASPLGRFVVFAWRRDGSCSHTLAWDDGGVPGEIPLAPWVRWASSPPVQAWLLGNGATAGVFVHDRDRGRWYVADPMTAAELTRPPKRVAAEA